MQYRKALIGAVATASLLGSIGAAQASHHPGEPNYSPCRPTDPEETRLGYSDAGDRDDPQKKLPTVYAKSDEDVPSGHIGICGGGGGDEPEVQFIEVGNTRDDGELVHHSDPPAVGASSHETTVNPAPDLGEVTVGDDYVEVDGNDDGPATAIHPYLGGYISVGQSEHDGDPGICMAGQKNREYYDANPTWKDCNDETVYAAVAEINGAIDG